MPETHEQDELSFLRDANEELLRLYQSAKFSWPRWASRRYVKENERDQFTLIDYKTGAPTRELLRESLPPFAQSAARKEDDIAFQLLCAGDFARAPDIGSATRVIHEGGFEFLLVPTSLEEKAFPIGIIASVRLDDDNPNVCYAIHDKECVEMRLADGGPKITIDVGKDAGKFLVMHSVDGVVLDAGGILRFTY